MQDPMDPHSHDESPDRPAEETPLRLPPGEAQRLTADQPPPDMPADDSRDTAPPMDLVAVLEAKEKPSEPAMPTWERMEEEGFWVSLFQTIKEVLLQPSRTFSRMPETDSIGRPLLFAIILLILGAIVTGAYGLLALSLNPGLVEQQQDMMAQFGRLGLDVPELTPRMLLTSTCISTALMPIVFVVGMFVASGISHLVLMLLGGKSRGYETTFRTMAYVVGATAILWLIPRVGLFPIAFVWGVFSGTAGLARTQKTPAGVAAVAVMVPLLLCGMCIVGLLLLPNLIAGAVQDTIGLP